jgi:hypothetical protein
MNHNYQVTDENPTECKVCGRSALDHGPYATCEMCKKERECDLIDGLLICHFCHNWKKKATQPELAQLDRQLDIRKKFKEIDDSVRVQTDIFNAKTVAIHELKVAIDNDSSIPVESKNFTLAQAVEARFNHLTDVIFSKRQEITDAESEKKAIQVYYNELAKRLRTEEREKIRLKDAQYKPAEVVVKKARVPSVKKFDKVAIRDAAKESGIPEGVLQMLCIAKGFTPLEAVRHYKESLSTIDMEVK